MAQHARREAGHKGDEGKRGRKTPRGRQGPGCSPREEKGGANGHGIQQQTQAHNAGHRASGGGWRVAGVGDVQVEGVPFWERRWGEGVTKR